MRKDEWPLALKERIEKEVKRIEKTNADYLQGIRYDCPLCGGTFYIKWERRSGILEIMCDCFYWKLVTCSKCKFFPRTKRKSHGERFCYFCGTKKTTRWHRFIPATGIIEYSCDNHAFMLANIKVDPFIYKKKICSMGIVTWPQSEKCTIFEEGEEDQYDNKIFL